jgi:hypothetical protein
MGDTYATMGKEAERAELHKTIWRIAMGHESSTITERRYIHLFDS